MSISEKLKSWYNRFQNYKVKYKDGFFHLSNLANSPETTIESLDKMPFIKHKRDKKLILVNTFFLNTQIYYVQLGEGLTVFISDFKIKKNIAIKNVFDKSMPIKHNILHLHYNKKTLESKEAIINGTLLCDKTWTVFKPGEVNMDYHFKDANELNVTIYFTDEWLEMECKSKEYFKGSNFEKFFNSQSTSILLNDTSLSNDAFYYDFLRLVEVNGDDSKNKEIKNLVSEFFKQFTLNYEVDTLDHRHFKLGDKDRTRIQKTEKYLLDNLLTSFPGIEVVAKKVGISPTKLKNDFKIIHNQSIFQYYRSHQMNLAYKLLLEKLYTVKEVARQIGYENESKFTAAFKSQFEVYPSDLLKASYKN